VNFWRVPEKKDVMWRNIRTTLVRAGLSEQEIATWRGMVKALSAAELS
jgi:tRNA C32,U32 (ribose-2'-O)-methylase TrmJ